MPQEKRFQSAAERQKAYRARKREALVDPDLPVVDVEDVAPVERPARVPLVTLERYVADCVRDAERFSRAIGEDDAPFTVATGVVVTNRRRDRLERAERYARWRYEGFQKGEVASL